MFLNRLMLSGVGWESCRKVVWCCERPMLPLMLPADFRLRCRMPVNRRAAAAVKS